jgi:hypothetical protein
MREFADIEQRIDVLCSPAAVESDDPRLLGELEDVLAAGYAYALRADARVRRLSERIDRLLGGPHDADEVHRLAGERHAIDEATRLLRARLGMVRALFAQVSGRADSA